MVSHQVRSFQLMMFWFCPKMTFFFQRVHVILRERFKMNERFCKVLISSVTPPELFTVGFNGFDGLFSLVSVLGFVLVR